MATHQIAATIFDQMGKYRLHGAYNLTGGRQLTFAPDRSLERVDVDEAGYLKTINGLMWRPNVTHPRVKFIIVLQPSDTYTIWLWKGYTTRQLVKNGGKKIGEVLEMVDDVYCDQLIDVIDHMYVEYVKKYQQGFIKI
jgi:hypothetical protein